MPQMRMDDGVAAGLIHQFDAVDADPGGLEQVACPGVLPAQAAPVAHLTAGAGHGQRLVGALAAEPDAVAVAGEGFAGRDQVGNAIDMVEIDRPEVVQHAVVRMKGLGETIPARVSGARATFASRAEAQYHIYTVIFLLEPPGRADGVRVFSRGGGE